MKDSEIPELTRGELLKITMAVKKVQIQKWIELFRKFIDTYQKTMSQMRMSIEEVFEIAREIIKK